MNYHLQLTGYVGGISFNTATVRKTLAQYPDKPVDVLIDSFGGSLPEGLSISAAFRDHGQVTVHFRGMNASAATVASMGAKKICIAPESMYLIHQVSLGFFDWASRNADELEQFIKELESTKEDLMMMDSNIAALYAARCKKTPKEMLDLMKAEKWITAQQAKDWGFVDEVTAYTDVAGKKQTITKEQATAFKNLGLPLPPVDVEPEYKTVFGSLINPIVDAIKSLKNMNNTTTAAPAAAAAEASAQNVQNPNGTVQNNAVTVQNNAVAEQNSTSAVQNGACGEQQNQVQNQQATQTTGDAAPATNGAGTAQNAAVDVNAELERLRAENAALKAKTPGAQTSQAIATSAASVENPKPKNDFTRYLETNASAKKLFDSLPD